MPKHRRPQSRSRIHTAFCGPACRRWAAALLSSVIIGLWVVGSAAAQTASQPAAPSRSSGGDHLRGGWYSWDPYQYRDYRGGVPVLTGFDVEIERALARVMNIDIALPQIDWDQHLADLATGKADIAAGATETEERGRYAYFSKPYRTETDVLIVPRGASGRYPFRTVDAMLDTFAKQKFRLGVVAGFVYADPRVNAFIADPANSDHIVAAATDADNLHHLLAGSIDGYLADRIAATTTAWRRGEGYRIEQHPLHFSTDIHFMLSRATQTPQMLARLNSAIDQLQASGELRRIADVYAVPALINQTLDSRWFRVLAFVGTVAFALSGVVLAYGGSYSIFGAMILAAMPAVGGGVVRDLILQCNPVAIVRSPESLLIVIGTVLAGLVVTRIASVVKIGRLAAYLKSRVDFGTLLIEVFDAAGLAAFTVVGVVAVLDSSAQPLWLWGPIAAVLTGSFGGLMRDLFRHDRMLANLRGELYPEIAAVWGLVLAIFLEWEGERLQPDEIRLGVIATILGAFLTRLVAIARGTKGWRYA